MSSIVATVSSIENCDSLHAIKFDYFSQTLSMMSLDIDPRIQVGTKVRLVMKPSHVAIAKNFSGDVSYSNILKTTIDSYKNGEILTTLKLKYFEAILESIITVASSKRMNLKKGDEVFALIKASELSIGEILDD